MVFRESDTQLHQKTMISRYRGPLKAVYTIEKQLSPRLNRCDGLRNSQLNKELKTSLDQPRTPFVRATRRVCAQRRSLRSISGLRSSFTCKSETTNNQMTEDIRTHFRHALAAENQQNVRVKAENNEESPQRSICHSNELSVGEKRAVDTPSNPSTAKQVRRCGQSQVNSHIDLDENGAIAMGASVRTNPRYQRRCSATSETYSPVKSEPTDEQGAFLNQSNRRLSPICPVPMPTAFHPQLPLTYSPISAPWDCLSVSPTKRQTDQHKTVQTQTSPTEIQDNPKNRESFESHENRKGNRRNSRSSLVINSIRKTFGSLRRAISAERLSRTVNEQSESKPTDSTSTPESHSLLKEKRGPVKAFRASSHEDEINVVAARSTPKDLSCARKIDNQRSQSLTCNVVSNLPDRSFRVILRRSSKIVQFGFFIARDKQGIYISRLGNVRCAAKLWDILHVGDRILEVQGVPCARLTVEDVQNLIRGCEIAEFRIKPGTAGFQPPFRC